MIHENSTIGDSPQLPNAVFCCAAAFTLDYDTIADHNRICSSHVTGGVYYKKPQASRYTGAFVTYDGDWAFLYDKDANPAAFDNAFQPTATNWLVFYSK